MATIQKRSRVLSQYEQIREGEYADLIDEQELYEAYKKIMENKLKLMIKILFLFLHSTYDIYQRKQNDEESFDEFLSTVRELASIQQYNKAVNFQAFYDPFSNLSVAPSSKVPDEIENAYANISTPKTKYKNIIRHKGKKPQNGSNQVHDIRKFLQEGNRKSTTRYHETRQIPPSPTDSQQYQSKFDENSSALKDKSNEITILTKEYQELTGSDPFDLSLIFKKTNELIHAMNERHNLLIQQFSTSQSKHTDFVTSEINALRCEINQVKSSHQEEIESLQIIDSSRSDLKKLWIRFKFRGEAQEIRGKGNYPAEIKKVLDKMGINFNLGILPLESAFFQDRKFGGSSIPEIALCCNFVNSTIARRVKIDIANFNKSLEEKGQRDMIRYFTTVSWSENVWKILRICFDIKGSGMLKSAFVTNEGIKVQYEIDSAPDDPNETVVDPNSSKVITAKINSMSALDELRKSIVDFNYQLPAVQVYSTEYFNLSMEQRKELRMNYQHEILEDDDNQMLIESNENY
ncbi:unnamed protein product [Chironomus riparius]|uniref:Uncharacterized protein n=1 Tax=Chironomus riparius TaxID=315576 RepID=A0A9N9RWT8_9DIPT|nr:unnamed protein product [Chironomus riparius]